MFKKKRLPVSMQPLPVAWGNAAGEIPPAIETEQMPAALSTEARVKSFADLITPAAIRFYTDHIICGDTYRCVWAVRDYPTSTKEQALLRGLGERDGVTLHLYIRHITPAEENKILAGATKKNRMVAGTDDLKQSVVAQSNLEDVASLIARMHRDKEPLVHTAVYMEMAARSLEALRELQTEVQTELARCKIQVDRLLLRQKEGFQCAGPVGYNALGIQYERVLPAGSAANLFPMNYSGKTDAHGFPIGRETCGSHILLDPFKHEDDKTNNGFLILGNSGQGKSYLLKGLLTIIRQIGKRALALDPEGEYKELTENLGGCYLDLMEGKHIINVLEPKLWADGIEDEDGQPAPAAFTAATRLAQHIGFLRDFFKAYKPGWEDRHLDTLEILLLRLYEDFGVREGSGSGNFPILSDLYRLVEQEYKQYDEKKKNLYTESTLQELALGLHSLCVGSDSRFFNGHTNITDSMFICFGVKGLLEANKCVKDAMLFNVLSYMSNELLTKGNAVASVDELYLFLSNLTAIEYIRNFMKRVRKKDSAVLLASQNLEDFDLEGVREYTKPLFAIPTHVFLFNAGNTNARFYMETLQLEQSEFELIKYPARGKCLYKCGNERYHLQVHFPEYQTRLFGSAGGR